MRSRMQPFWYSSANQFLNGKLVKSIQPGQQVFLNIPKGIGIGRHVSLMPKNLERFVRMRWFDHAGESSLMIQNISLNQINLETISVKTE